MHSKVIYVPNKKKKNTEKKEICDFYHYVDFTTIYILNQDICNLLSIINYI